MATDKYIPKHMKDEKLEKKPKNKIIIALIVVVAILVICIVWGLISVFSVQKIASDIKVSVKTFASAVVSGDSDGMNRAVNDLDKSSDKLSQKLSSPIWKVAAKAPVVGGDVKSARVLANVLSDAVDSAIRPAIKVINENPVSGIKMGDDGYNINTIISYVDFAEGLMPKLGEYSKSLSGISFKVIKLGSVSEYIDMIKSLSGAYDKYSSYVPLIKAFLGDGSDKYYLIAAQATNEMRATGGFPGSMGSLVIKDGVLSLGDFSSVTNYLPGWNAESATPSNNDIALFGFWVNFPRNACCYLNFERTGYCWAEDCEKMTGQHVDGVISMTPAVVQKLLSVIDGEIKLTDGTVVNGKNATKAIMYDLYFKYFSKERYDATSNTESDSMFAETADKAMKLFLSSVDVKKVDEYINIFDESAKENIFKLWLRDEEGEKLIKELGMAGTTNDDKNHPFAGIYLSINVPCKMGWFVDIEPVLSNPVKNEDGSMTYDMKVTFRNTISKEELKTASAYILGRTNGNIRCNLYFTAPMEGKVSDFSVTAANKFGIKKGTYYNLDLGYCNSIFLYPEKDVVVSYKVTTAPGVSTPLEIVQTPTATAFR